MVDELDTLLAQLELPPLLLADDVRARLRASSVAQTTRESWKYTQLKKFVPNDVAVSEPTISADGPPAAVVSRLSTQPSDGLNRHLGDADSSSRFPLADLALLIAGDCLIVDIPSDRETDLSITFHPGINVPVLIRVAARATLRLQETVVASEFANHSLYLLIDEDASVEHARTAFTSHCNHWSLSQAVLGVRSSYKLQQYLGGGNQRRYETQIILDGRESNASLTGAYRVHSGGHLDQQITVEHRAPDTLSEQRFHGIGAGKGSAIFNGRIHIHPDSPRSNAQLSNRNLALHPDAIINTKPELEIYTDDVKCAHGATVGQLSADSLFYLQSRGIALPAARQMLCRAFIRECIEGPLADIASEALLDEITTAVASNESL
jgi:Fe-S cluster assembly protein SufD